MFLSQKSKKIIFFTILIILFSSLSFFVYFNNVQKQTDNIIGENLFVSVRSIPLTFFVENINITSYDKKDLFLSIKNGTIPIIAVYKGRYKYFFDRKSNRYKKEEIDINLPYITPRYYLEFCVPSYFNKSLLQCTYTYVFDNFSLSKEFYDNISYNTTNDETIFLSKKFYDPYIISNSFFIEDKTPYFFKGNYYFNKTSNISVLNFALNINNTVLLFKGYYDIYPPKSINLENTPQKIKFISRIV